MSRSDLNSLSLSLSLSQPRCDTLAGWQLRNILFDRGSSRRNANAAAETRKRKRRDRFHVVRGYIIAQSRAEQYPGVRLSDGCLEKGHEREVNFYSRARDRHHLLSQALLAGGSDLHY